MDIIKDIAEKRLKSRHEEDFADRANYVTTPFVLSVAAVLCFAKQYGPWSKPLYCWTNSEWNSQWIEYAEDYCFVESTYYVPINETIPLRGRRNNADDQVNYYQWLPFILVSMSFVCQMPHYFWRLCNSISGKNLPKIIRQAHDAVGQFDEENVAAGIGRHLYIVLSGRGEYDQQNGWKVYRAYKWLSTQICRHMLCFFYLVMKVFFLVTNIGQLFFITYFLGAVETPKWGLQMLESFIEYGTAWEQSGLFPRISLCDFRIRMPGENCDLDYTVQCLLIANFLNEKIFLVLYYLFAFMTMFTILNLFWWFWLLFTPPNDNVRKMIELSAMQIYPDPEMPKQIVTEDALTSFEWSANSIEDSDWNEMTISQLSPPPSYHQRVSPAISNGTTNTLLSASRTTPTNMGRMEEQFGAEDRQNDDQEMLNEDLSPGTPNSSKRKVDIDEATKWELDLLDAQEKRKEFCRLYHKHKGEFLQILGSDGILAFNLIRVNAGHQMASLIIGGIFGNFIKSKNDREKENMDLPPV